VCRFFPELSSPIALRISISRLITVKIRLAQFFSFKRIGEYLSLTVLFIASTFFLNSLVFSKRSTSLNQVRLSGSFCFHQFLLYGLGKYCKFNTCGCVKYKAEIPRVAKCLILVGERFTPWLERARIKISQKECQLIYSAR
jgi:hypothetical protein